MLDCMVRLCLVCKKLPNCLKKWLYQFVFPPTINKNSSCCTSSPAYGIASVLDFCHSHRCIVVSHCRFNLQFPIYIQCWASFKCLFAICIFSLISCLSDLSPIYIYEREVFLQVCGLSFYGLSSVSCRAVFNFKDI